MPFSVDRPVRILIEGPPKVGKTTVIERLVGLLGEAGTPTAGFITHEVRGTDGRRVGFVARDLSGAEAWLAHQDSQSAVRVGRFGVNVEGFERVAVDALVRARRLARDAGGVVVVDEIARMELASAEFVRQIDELFNEPVNILASVHMYEHPVTDALKQRGDVERMVVTESNRDELPRRLQARLTGLKVEDA